MRVKSSTTQPSPGSRKRTALFHRDTRKPYTPVSRISVITGGGRELELELAFSSPVITRYRRTCARPQNADTEGNPVTEVSGQHATAPGSSVLRSTGSGLQQQAEVFRAQPEPCGPHCSVRTAVQVGHGPQRQTHAGRPAGGAEAEAELRAGLLRKSSARVLLRSDRSGNSRNPQPAILLLQRQINGISRNFQRLVETLLRGPAQQ